MTKLYLDATGRLMLLVSTGLSGRRWTVDYQAREERFQAAAALAAQRSAALASAWEETCRRLETL